MPQNGANPFRELLPQRLLALPNGRRSLRLGNASQAECRQKVGGRIDHEGQRRAEHLDQHPGAGKPQPLGHRIGYAQLAIGFHQARAIDNDGQQ